MFRFLTLAMLMVGALVVIAGPLTRTCTKTTGPKGEIIETCLVVGRIGNRDINQTEMTISGPGSITINEPGLRVEVGNTHIVRGNYDNTNSEWDTDALDDMFDDDGFLLMTNLDIK